VALARLNAERYRQHITANEIERAALAERFQLLSLARLEADVELRREPLGTILLSARFMAEFAQSCIVTLAPITGSADERFELRFGPPETEASLPRGDDDPAFEPLDGDAIDIGEAVAQEFSLALPPFPRAADAVAETETSTTPEEDGPFAVLRRLTRRDAQ
jgi:uncharacterized metal-binding protein YceD (DUF177 family)